jgi:cytosine/adenosine deaminase-related metal-dependent hydrolase
VTRSVVAGCAIATVDSAETEIDDGYLVIDDGVLIAIGAGQPPSQPEGTEWIDGTGCLATPGFINTHHHLNQWITRGLAQDSTLFEWLVELYPVWAGADADLEYASARGALAALALSGCTTAMDHNYLFPRDGGDILAAEIAAARSIGLRFHPTRGSMDRGVSTGGLPPDSVVEDIDSVLAATSSAIDEWHDPSPGSMLRIGVAPCSPFTNTSELMKLSAELGRAKGVRLHTHGAETLDEEEFCRAEFGCTPVEYLESLGWLGPDVWLAHCVHLDDNAIAAMARTSTGVAHCPSSNGRLGAGMARAADLMAAGVAVGLGVDGAASNEDGALVTELRQALLTARLRGGPRAMTARQALRLATMGGARVLGRSEAIGSLEVGKRADLALWDLCGVGHAGIADPVAALVLGPRPPLRLLMVDGDVVVEDAELRTASEAEVAAEVATASREILRRATHLSP